MLTIKAITIPDAWFQLIYALEKHGRKYINQKGSYVGEERIELPFTIVEIFQPYAEPYDRMLPEIPGHFNIPNPVTEGYVEEYMPYLMEGVTNPEEQYTYGSQMRPQIDHWIDELKKTPNTNQAILQVGQPYDYRLSDPPCLRHIDMRIQDGKLFFFPYFRSWDLWGGFPANLAGIAVLQRFMSDSIGCGLGSITASSKGLHIYGYAEELVKIRTNRI